MDFEQWYEALIDQVTVLADNDYLLAKVIARTKAEPSLPEAIASAKHLTNHKLLTLLENVIAEYEQRNLTAP